MATLLGDFGYPARVRMNIHAAAAKGIIERQGLSKVRHIDVNVLWLQEVCARKAVPIDKVPGEENPADLTTKHLGAQLIEKNVNKMHLTFEAGRASVAAQLHNLIMKESIAADRACSVDSLGQLWSSVGSIRKGNLWKEARKFLGDVRGGDQWISRGQHGEWKRLHATPRQSLFTPFRVAKGPSKDLKLNPSRRTIGVTKSGEKFELVDNWMSSENSHRRLDEQFIGFTIFTQQGSKYSSLQEHDRKGASWSDLTDATTESQPEL